MAEIITRFWASGGRPRSPRSRRPTASSPGSTIPTSIPGDKSAEAKFKEIQEAYAVLSDPKKRAQYDQFGFAGDRPPGGPVRVRARASGDSRDSISRISGRLRSATSSRTSSAARRAAGPAHAPRPPSAAKTSSTR